MASSSSARISPTSCVASAPRARARSVRCRAGARPPRARLGALGGSFGTVADPEGTRGVPARTIAAFGVPRCGRSRASLARGIDVVRARRARVREIAREDIQAPAPGADLGGEQPERRSSAPRRLRFVVGGAGAAPSSRRPSKGSPEPVTEVDLPRGRASDREHRTAHAASATTCLMPAGRRSSSAASSSFARWVMSIRRASGNRPLNCSS